MADYEEEARKLLDEYEKRLADLQKKDSVTLEECMELMALSDKAKMLCDMGRSANLLRVMESVGEE